MSSNIKIQRICQYCNDEFTARTTVTKYCSLKCAQRAYKSRTRKKKIEKSNTETKKATSQPLEVIKSKEFLTVRDVSILIGCSIRTAYRLIDNGTLKAVNLAERMTRIKKSELNKILEQPQPIPQIIKPEFAISECYTLKEVQDKYSISATALQNLIKRESIPKIKKGWYAYVPKIVIDDLLT